MFPALKRHATVVPGNRGALKQLLNMQVRCLSHIFDAHDTFVRRHNGVNSEADLKTMLKVVGASSLDDLIAQTVPATIRLKEDLKLGPERGESSMLKEFHEMMDKNEIYRTHIGTGYHDVLTPTVILRNILENPAWYTPYTPYQAEISQGRLEMLLNYQTMIIDLTGMPVSNASLLDEATAAAEAMTMVWAAKKPKFLISEDCHPQTIEVMKTRAKQIGIEIVVQSHTEFDFSQSDVSGILVQYPTTYGTIHDYRDLTTKAHDGGAKVVVAADLLSLASLTPPGEWGADCVVGSAQRFGVPMGFGGPHAAFFAVTDGLKRKMPGRIIGVSRDSRGKPALRMAMQTREQHIRRDKATSNICTAQALLANIAAAYGVYHGPQGLKQISEKVHAFAKVFAAGCTQLNIPVASNDFFDTVHLVVPGQADKFVQACLDNQINIRRVDGDNVCVTFDEATLDSHVNELVNIFGSVVGHELSFDARATADSIDLSFPSGLTRSSEYLTHPVFHMYHSETDMLRYLYSLQMKDLSLCTAMIPLGSCTMKLNATSEMIPVTWPKVGNMHPFAPVEQTKGYTEMLSTIVSDLAEITGFYTVSMQPNAGSQGEYAGLLTIMAYHRSRGEGDRNICLIPVSAHGTNPASAVMSGMKVVVVKCDSEGNIDWEDLKAKVEKHSSNLGALMVTYPSTHGVFEENIREVCDLIHEHGGQVYMDGANMNAQVGLCTPGDMGADVCHLNLHKTFCIPHGGGGPGMGPIGVAKQLAPFLPSHPIIPCGGEQGIGAIAAAPYSSASILPISWMYIRMMGGQGLKRATEIAILNANYMAARLSEHFNILYTGKNGFCAHEFILDLRPFKKVGIVEEDVAKRLMDYNFHAPTMSWPVVGTLMVEPTESEPLYELDRMCDALISIRKEIAEIEMGIVDEKDNLLKNAPHTSDMITGEWNRPYSRERAVFPMEYLKQNKFWPTTGRLDNVYGDRNVVCSCPPIESYSSQE